MGNYTTYVGMDVHARSITAKSLVLETGETSTKVFKAGYCAADIAQWASKFPMPVYFAYESGCTGTVLARNLRELGYACDVIAVSTLSFSTKDKQRKCDKVDAGVILKAITQKNPEYSCVWIPTIEQDGLRELYRAFESAKDEVKRSKQQLSSFLLRQGIVWNELTKTGNLKKPCGQAFEQWLSSISFEDTNLQHTYLSYIERLCAAERELKKLEVRLKEAESSPENVSYIEALSEVKGIDRHTAMAVRVEIGDFERFSNPRSLSAYIGTVPLDHSSGPKCVHGSITKAGDKHIRRALVEGVGSISTWKTPYKKTSSPTTPTAPIALKANERLFEKYRHLTRENHKHTNVAKMAVVSELIRWLWIIGREVQRREQLQSKG